MTRSRSKSRVCCGLRAWRGARKQMEETRQSRVKAHRDRVLFLFFDAGVTPPLMPLLLAPPPPLLLLLLFVPLLLLLLPTLLLPLMILLLLLLLLLLLPPPYPAAAAAAVALAPSPLLDTAASSAIRFLLRFFEYLKCRQCLCVCVCVYVALSVCLRCVREENHRIR